MFPSHCVVQSTSAPTENLPAHSHVRVIAPAPAVPRGTILVADAAACAALPSAPVHSIDTIPAPVAEELEHVWVYNGVGSCTKLDADGSEALLAAAAHWSLALDPGRFFGHGTETSAWIRHRTHLDGATRNVAEARFRGGGSIFFASEPDSGWTCAVAWSGSTVAGVLVGSDYGYAVWGGEGWICSHGENDYRAFDAATVDPPEAAAAMRYSLERMLQWGSDCSAD